MTREIRHGASRPDPHETSVSQVNRNVTGRVGLGHEVFEIVVVVAASATMQSVVTGQP